MIKFAAAFLAASAASCLAWAGVFTVEVKTDRPAVGYAVGEPVTFTVKLLEDGRLAPGHTLRWVREGDDRKTERGEAASDTPLVLLTTLDRPGFARLKIDVLDATGEPLKNGDRKVERTAGAAAGLADFPLAPEPADFDAFWTRQKERLAATPVRELERCPVDSKTRGVVTHDIKVDSPGGKPVSAYLSLPENAQPGSLPARIVFFGYGVYPIATNAGAARDRIVLSVNAHGMLNGQSREYYQELSKGELSNYIFNGRGNDDPESTYLNGMMLRALRAVEYIKTLPEWNGRDIETSGHSQGGLQAIVVAAHDPAVTLCTANQPWLCDIGGAAMGHLRGGWTVKPTPALLYYDPAYHVRRYEGELRLMAGLGDYVCPPSGIASVYNQAPGAKRIVYTQGAGHVPNARGEQFVRNSP